MAIMMENLQQFRKRIKETINELDKPLEEINNEMERLKEKRRKYENDIYQEKEILLKKKIMFLIFFKI